MAKVYNGYFDISHMIETAKREHICFVIAVSEDKERGAGKTYSSAKFLFEHYVNEGERFVIFVRRVKELGHIAEGIFDSYLADNYPEISVYEKKQENIFSMIYTVQGKGEDKKTDVIGFVAPLVNARNIKQYRGIFQSYNVRYFYMDEFMPLDGQYLNGETDLMKTIYDTVNGKIEDLPIIMTANCISLGNPYFTMLKLNSKIQSNTRSIKTETCVYENVTVEGLAEKHINSAANKAFGKNTEDYVSNAWIGDNNSLVSKPDEWGRGRYTCTIIYNNQRIGVYSYDSVGYRYISRKVDKSCPFEYNLTLDGDLNIPLLRTTPFIRRLRDEFFKGIVRVSDGGLQRMLMEIFG